VAVVVRRRTRNVSLLVVVWLLVGLVVAVQRGYITATLLRGIVSAVLAILLWPLVLLGIDLKI
jgi:predicted PurR-regulated permease PerM